MDEEDDLVDFLSSLDSQIAGNDRRPVNVGAICAAGVTLSGMWFAYIADHKPRTFTPAWEKATIKYRAAQNQDPISNMS